MAAGPGSPLPRPPPALEERSDEVLAATAGGGDDAAFVELFRRYRGRIEGFVRWQGAAEGDAAEELAQEVFVQLYRSLPAYAERSSFRTWLYALARNVCLYQRRRSRRLRAVERAPEELGPQGWRRIPDLGPDAAERLAAGELRQRVRRQVAELPPIYRSVLVLRDWEDLSYAEIAELLEIPVGTVRSRLHEARTRLAGGLSDRREEDDNDGL